MGYPSNADVRSGIAFGPADGSILLQGIGATFATQNYGKLHTFAGWVYLLVAAGNRNKLWSLSTGARQVVDIFNGTLVYNAGGSIVSVAYVWPVCTWIHLAVTRSSTSVKFYINGAQQGATQTLSADTDMYDISTVSASGANAIKGCLDEFAAWSRVLTDAEISNLYNAGTGFYITGNFPSTGTPVATNLLHLYHFDEMIGTIASDLGSLALNLTLTSAVFSRGKITCPLPYLGTLDLPAVGNVRAGIQFDGLSKTGLLDLPAVADVKDGVWFDNHTKEGELVSTLPAVGDVRAGTPVGGDVGTLELPAEAEVLDGVGFGTDATEFVGSLGPVLPTKEITGEITSFVIEGEVVMEA